MTKTRALALLIAAVVYLILPTDILPDFVPFIGWVDDLLILLVSGWIFMEQWKKPGASKARHEDVPADPWAVLGVGRGASKEEIKKAYREQMAQYHPDKVDHLGPDLKRVAHEKTLAIQRAYEALGGE